MSTAQGTKARFHVGGLYIGNAVSAGASETAVGSPRDFLGFLDVITTGTITPGAIAAGATYTTTVTYAGAEVAGSAISSELAAPPGDFVQVLYVPPSAEYGIIIQAFVSAANTIRLVFTNASGSSITPTARAYNLLFLAINHD
jgi:hypothetical protein